MKKLFILLLLLMGLYSCANTDETENLPPKKTMPADDYIPEAVYRKVSAEEARDLMSAAKSFILLDVRTEAEYKEKRIDGAMLMPDYEVAGRAEAELADKTALIFIYCRSGRRSANAAKELVDMGYTNVYDFGGINDWAYETVSG